MAGDGPPPLVAALAERYGVGRQLVEAYLHHWERTQGQRLSTLAEVDALRPPRSGWLDHALASNRDALVLADAIATRLAPAADPVRLLELGCGIGGLLVAGAARGWSVVGYEPDSGRRRLAAANLRDHDLEPDEVLVPAPEQPLAGRWSAVVSLDPEGYADDALDAVLRLAAAVGPGGVLVVRLANRTSLALARSGPRTDLPGAVLLSRQARGALLAALGSDVAPGATLRSTVVIRDALLERGFAVERLVVEPWPERQVASAGDLLADLFEAFVRFTSGPGRRLGRELAGTLEGHLLALVRSAVSDLGAAAHDPRALRTFHDRYLVDFETLLARRS